MEWVPKKYHPLSAMNWEENHDKKNRRRTSRDESIEEIRIGISVFQNQNGCNYAQEIP